MSTIIQGPAIRTAQFGVQLIKASQNMPQGVTTATLATVSGGAVLITSLLGLVTTATGSTALSTIALGTVPSIGSASTTGIMAATPVISIPVGTWIGLVQSAGVGAVGAIPSNAGGAVFLTTPFVVSAGTITWTSATANTGQIKWYFTYIGLDNGAGIS